MNDGPIDNPFQRHTGTPAEFPGLAQARERSKANVLPQNKCQRIVTVFGREYYAKLDMAIDYNGQFISAGPVYMEPDRSGTTMKPVLISKVDFIGVPFVIELINVPDWWEQAVDNVSKVIQP